MSHPLSSLKSGTPSSSRLYHKYIGGYWYVRLPGTGMAFIYRPTLVPVTPAQPLHMTLQHAPQR